MSTTTILACGGVSNWDPIKYVDLCFSSDGSKWVPHGKLKTPRYAASSIALTGDSSKLWVVGGFNKVALNTTELVHLNRTVEKGPLLQHPLMGHCIASHQDKIIITGGHYETPNPTDTTITKLTPHFQSQCI